MSFDNVLRVNSSVVGLLSVVTMSLSSCFRDFFRDMVMICLANWYLVLVVKCYLLRNALSLLKGLFIPLAIVTKEWSNLYLTFIKILNDSLTSYKIQSFLTECTHYKHFPREW